MLALPAALLVVLAALATLLLAGCASGGPGAGVSPATPPSPTPPSARAGAPAPTPATAPGVPTPSTPPDPETERLPGEEGEPVEDLGDQEGGDESGDDDSDTGGDEASGEAGDEEGEEEGSEGEPPVRAQTPGERQAALDRELAESLEDFDRRMLEKLERAERQRMAAAGARTSGSAAGGSAPGAAGAAGAAGASGEGRTGESAPSSGSDNSRGGAVGGTGGEPVTDDTAPPRDDRTPADIPDGRDDDVVARQLREAALAEDDPELRRRLWDEYRRYKGLPMPTGDGEAGARDETPPAEPTATDSR